MRAVSLVLGLTLVGCGAVSSVDTPGIGPHLPAALAYDLWLDPSLSPESSAATTAAVAQWMEFTDVQITVHSGVRVCVDDCFSVHEVPEADLNLPFEGQYIGYTIPGFIFLASKLDAGKLDETAIHELGHALGLEHRPVGTNAVMVGTYYQAAKHVTCDDVAQYNAERSSGPSVFVAPCSDAPGTLP